MTPRLIRQKKMTGITEREWKDSRRKDGEQE